MLEAIGFLCLGKSFLSARDRHVVRQGETFFDVEGALGSDQRATATVRVAVVPGEGKRAFVNGVPLDRLADLVGKAPVVILSPADAELTAGGPSERRRFLDTTLSQSSPVYLDDLMKYRRALKQRNALLQHVKKGGALPPGTMDAWDEEVAVLGGRIMMRRRSFLDQFRTFVDEAYHLLEAPGAPPSLTYQPSADEGEEAEAALRRALGRTRQRGRQLGRTPVGPHLDEVVFQLGGLDLRPFASQGQHRTFALVLRFAEALFLRDRLEEDPLLLLDDVFGPLDPERTRLVLDLLQGGAMGQSFLTAAGQEPFVGLVPFHKEEHGLFHVEHGAVAPAPS